ncbi:MAG: glycoside hydrolase family 127 protein [Lentisphaeria bacterium]|nr:glycoside hydrolase family 127 protein [Lentisphaeria bacterium]
MRKNRLKGAIGEAVTRTVANRLKTVDYRLLAEPFVLRNEKDNAWRCEFWGKVVRSAVGCAFFTGDAELRALVDSAVADLMKSRTADGCISSYPGELQLGGWDVWGRKYALLGLIRYYELLNRDPEVLTCCCRAADHLMTQVGPGKTDILECGCHDGLAASSILGAFVSLYRLTGEEKYRDFARYIISRGCSRLGNIFESAAAGAVPAALGNGKAYEMTSCFQGLAELALLEPDPGARDTVEKYYRAVLEREIFVTGGGGLKDRCGEFWYDGAFRQTRGDCGALGETCVTATWLRYCARILQLTDDPKVADEMEKSLYNALLGALAPDGTRWVHANPTPLAGGGYKQCADDQIGRGFGTPYGGNDCCRAQGPEGLVIASEIAVTENENGVTVNLFEPLESDHLEISGNYPFVPRAVIRFSDPRERVLRLRTPAFLGSVRLNGAAVPFRTGVYLELPHRAGECDEVVLDFDFSLAEIPSPDGRGFVAVRRGPLVLAEDSRGEVPGAAVRETWRGRKLCEYACAGNLMRQDNTLTVWFGKGNLRENRAKYSQTIKTSMTAGAKK